MKYKNIVFVAQSLDGYIAGPNGELEWLDAIPNPEKNDMGFVGLMNDIDAIVMGRATFETVLGFDGEWPYTKHIFVLSNSISEIPEKLKEKATLLHGSIEKILDDIHEKGFFNLYIDGGKTIQNFLKEDLIHELRISTMPLILGGGIPLFHHLPISMKFNHLKTEVFLNQIVQSHYERKK